MKKKLKKLPAGKRFGFGNYPEAPHEFRMKYYSAALVTLQELLSPEETSLLNKLAGLTGQCSYEFAKTLGQLEELEKRLTNAPLTMPEKRQYQTLPFSMMSYIGNVKEDDRTEYVANVTYDERDFLDIVGLKKGDGRIIKKETRNNYIGRLQAIFRTLVDRFIDNGIYDALLDETYVWYVASPSGLKKMSSYFLSKSFIMNHPAIMWWGLNPHWFNQRKAKGFIFTKVLQMRALMFSSAVPSSDVYGHPINIDKIIVMDKVQVTVHGDVDHVSLNGKVTRELNAEVDRAFGDGQGEGNARKFGHCAAQVRCLFVKGLIHFGDIVKWARLHGVKQVIVEDLYGKKWDLENEDWDIILTPDSFKAHGLYGLEWPEVIGICEAVGIDQFFICGIAQKEKDTVNVSRQMNNSLVGLNDKALHDYINPTIKKLERCNSYDGAVALLSEDDERHAEKSGLAHVMAVAPEAIGIKEVFQEAGTRYQLRWCRAMSGEIRTKGIMEYALDDPTISYRAWLGLPYNEKGDILHAGCMACSDAPRALLDVLRSPHAYMEHNPLRNVWTPVHAQWYAPHMVVLNGRDLTPRVLMCDTDGDHLTVVFDEKLAFAITVMKRQLDIVPLLYEAQKGDPKPLGETREAFNEQVKECIFTCQAYNKVGINSNLIAHAWADWNEVPLTAEQARERLHRIAFVAMKVNEAVDAQKTYKYIELPSDLIKELRKKPASQRYYKAKRNPIPNEENGYELTTMGRQEHDYLMPAKKGAVDRMSAMIREKVGPHLEIKEEIPGFDWDWMIPTGKLTQIGKGPMTAQLLSLLYSLGKPMLQTTEELMEKAKAGESLQLFELMEILKDLTESAYAKFAKTEDNQIALSVAYVRMLDTAKKIIFNWAYFNTSELKKRRANGTLSSSFVEKCVLKHLVKSLRVDKHGNIRLFAFDLFGETWAPIIAKNKQTVLVESGMPVVAEVQKVTAVNGVRVVKD